MTENPRPAILRHARQRTVAIVLTAAAGTGVLTAVIAHQATAATGTGTGDSTIFRFDGLLGGPGDRSGSGIDSPSDQGQSDGGSHSS